MNITICNTIKQRIQVKTNAINGLKKQFELLRSYKENVDNSSNQIYKLMTMNHTPSTHSNNKNNHHTPNQTNITNNATNSTSLSTSTPNNQVNFFTQTTRNQILAATTNFNNTLNKDEVESLELRKFQFKMPQLNNSVQNYQNVAQELNFNDEKSFTSNNNNTVALSNLSRIDTSIGNDSGVGSKTNSMFNNNDISKDQSKLRLKLMNFIEYSSTYTRFFNFK